MKSMLYGRPQGPRCRTTGLMPKLFHLDDSRWPLLERKALARSWRNPSSRKGLFQDYAKTRKKGPTGNNAVRLPLRKKNAAELAGLGFFGQECAIGYIQTLARRGSLAGKHQVGGDQPVMPTWTLTKFRARAASGL